MRTLTENYYIEAVSPQLVNNNTVATPWLLMDAVDPVLYYLRVGATDITVDAKVQQATASDGTGAKDVTGAHITQLAATDDNKSVSIELEPARLDLKGGFVYARLLVTVGNGSTGANVTAVVFHRTRHNPPTQPASFVQQVRVAVEEHTS